MNRSEPVTGRTDRARMPSRVMPADLSPHVEYFRNVREVAPK